MGRWNPDMEQCWKLRENVCRNVQSLHNVREKLIEICTPKKRKSKDILHENVRKNVQILANERKYRGPCMFWEVGGGVNEQKQEVYRNRTICKDKIKIWSWLTMRHILQSSITTDSHILGWADGTQTWNNTESCAKMLVEMSKVCIMFAKNW